MAPAKIDLSVGRSKMRLRQSQLIQMFQEGATSGKARYGMEIDGDFFYSWGHPIARRYNGLYLISTMYNGGSIRHQLHASRHIMYITYGLNRNNAKKRFRFVQGWADEDCHKRILKHNYAPRYTTDWGICRAFYKFHWASFWKGNFWDGTKQTVDMEIKGLEVYKGDNATFLHEGKCVALRVHTSFCFFNKVMNQQDCPKCHSRFQCFTEKDFGRGHQFFVVKGTKLESMLHRHFLLQQGHRQKYTMFSSEEGIPPTYREVTKEEARRLQQALRQQHQDKE